MVGPFIFFDHIGPMDLAPGLDRKFDVRAHPHIGLSTVTYLFSGEIIAGSAYGLTAGAKTHSPLFYAHLDMEPGAVAEVPADHPERAIYLASGAVEMAGERYAAGKMLVLGVGTSHFRAQERSTVMVLGGEPVGPVRTQA